MSFIAAEVKEYKTASTRLKVIHRPCPASNIESSTDRSEQKNLQPTSKQKPKTWSPINSDLYKSYEDDTDSEDEVLDSNTDHEFEENNERESDKEIEDELIDPILEEIQMEQPQE